MPTNNTHLLQFKIQKALAKRRTLNDGVSKLMYQNHQTRFEMVHFTGVVQIPQNLEFINLKHVSLHTTHLGILNDQSIMNIIATNGEWFYLCILNRMAQLITRMLDQYDNAFFSSRSYRLHEYILRCNNNIFLCRKVFHVICR